MEELMLCDLCTRVHDVNDRFQQHKLYANNRM